MALLTDQEQVLVEKIVQNLTQDFPETKEHVERWLSIMEQLEQTLSAIPSILQKTSDISHKAIYKSRRYRQTLLDSLLVNREGDKMLYLPAKAILSKGFLVAKYHAFNLLLYSAQEAEMSETDLQAIKDITNSLIFTLMAEDVYSNMLDDLSFPEVVRRQVAMALIILWEQRSDFIIKENHMSAIMAVWEAKKKHQAVLGTMMGMSELWIISEGLDDMWNRFLIEKINDPEVRVALDEFLFGHPYEQVQALKAAQNGQGHSAIDRKDASSMLQEDITDDTDVGIDDFYMMYTIRRDNARARRRLHHPGPHNTLEDYYMAYVFEQYRKKDFAGVDVIHK
jgi:hypothetical protein